MEVGKFVVHEKDILDVWQRIRDIRNCVYSVVGQNKRCESIEIGKIAEFSDLIITHVNALEKILNRCKCTSVAPMF